MSRVCSSPRRHSALTHAFTLVELLVVIGIIAVLISILLPSLSRARESANSVKCLANLKQLGSTMLMYCNDNRGRFPGTAAASRNLQSEDWIIWRPITETVGGTLTPANSAFARYLGSSMDTTVLRCPSDDPTSHLAISSPSTVAYPYSYVLNSRTTSLPINSASETATKITQVVNSSDKVLMYEESERSICDGNGDLSADVTVPAAWVWSNDFPSVRHAGNRKSPDAFDKNLDARSNVLFADFHAAAVTRRELEDPIHAKPLQR